MVTISFETLDTLVYADQPMSEEERLNAELMIREELQISEIPEEGGCELQMHPRLNGLLQSGNIEERPMSLLFKEIDRYESEQRKDDGEKILNGGIDISRYTDFNDQDSGIRYNDVYLTLSFASMHERSLKVAEANSESTQSIENKDLSSLSNIRENYIQSKHQKRRNIDELNEIRKKRQVIDFGPVNNFLSDKWKDGIRSVVEAGMETSRIDMEKY